MIVEQHVDEDDPLSATDSAQDSPTSNEPNLESDEELHKRVIGQSQAVEVISKAIRRSRAGLKDPKRPTGSFILGGPAADAGVGAASATYCVTAGVAVRMRSFSRAIFSTRRCVACA